MRFSKPAYSNEHYSRRPAVSMPDMTPTNSFFNVFDSSNYLSCGQLYYGRFGVYPSIIRLTNVAHKKAMTWVETHLTARVEAKYLCEVWKEKKTRQQLNNVLYVLGEGLLVDIEANGTTCVLYNDSCSEEAQQISGKLRKLRARQKPEPAVHLITNGNGFMDLKKVTFKAPKLVLETHYNDDLLPLHEQWKAALSKKGEAGLYLLHGVPGTGKSTYLQHLIAGFRKRTIFLSPKLAATLDTPQFTELLLDNENSIVVIEDAEELLISREQERGSAISMLLNLTDGILGNSLGIQFLCTFNTQIGRLDSALLRKGRLKGVYEFKPLEASKATALLRQLYGPEESTDAPLTLAEIYNWKAPDFSVVPQRAAIGFGKA